MGIDWLLWVVCVRITLFECVANVLCDLLFFMDFLSAKCDDVA